MPEDMLAVAQKALGPLQWYSKSQTENNCTLRFEISLKHFYSNFLIYSYQIVQMVTRAPLERYVVFRLFFS